jgi:hypothetical protein
MKGSLLQSPSVCRHDKHIITCDIVLTALENPFEKYDRKMASLRPVLSIQYLADIRADILADIWSPHHSSTPKVLNIGQKYRH